MMVSEIVDHALNNDIHLYVLDGKLKYTAKTGKLSDSFKATLKKHKAELIQFLDSIDEKQVDDADHKPVVFKRQVSKDEKIPLSFAQQRLWFLSQYIGPSSIYNVSLAIRVQGDIDEDLLLKSCQSVFARQESLRTKFVEVDGIAYQEVAPLRKNINVQVVSSVKEACDIWLSEKSYPFNMHRDDLTRVKILLDKSSGSDSGDSSDYIIMLTMHHSVTDAWSMGIFFRELLSSYSALACGQSVNMEPMDIQYADYSIWQKKYVSGRLLTNQLQYWRDQLDGVPSEINLPLDNKRPKKQTFNGGSCNIELNPLVSKELIELSRKNSATLYITLLSLFSVLLFRYSGQKDMAIGSPVTNRSDKSIENLIGFFVNTLVMRVRIGKNDSFNDLVQATRDTVLESFENQDMPFEKLVEELSPQRELSHSPLFQVAFTLQNVPTPSKSIAGIKLLPFTLDDDMETDTAKTVSRFDLTLRLQETESGIKGDFEFNCDLFNYSTIESMARHFKSLSEVVTDNPSVSIQQLNFLSTFEKKIQLDEWNDTDNLEYNKRCIKERFEDQAHANPDAIALVFNNSHISYSKLNIVTNHIANTLIEHGVGPETNVGICCERSVEMVLAILATLKSGASYVPLEPSYPSSRINHMLTECEIKVVFSSSGCIDNLKNIHDSSIVTMNLSEIEFSNLSTDENPRLAHTSKNTSYVIYTSGSTGKPKGVMISNEALVNRIDWMQREYQLNSEDRVLQKTPFSFDVSVWEFVWPLSHGACLVVAKPDGHKDAEYLNQIIYQEYISVIHFVPSMLDVFLDEASKTSLRSIKQVICSGEALTTKLEEKFNLIETKAKLNNLYGPTEAAIDVSYWQSNGKDTSIGIPIGKPIQNIKLYIVDTNFNLLPKGCVGELLIGGIGLSRGYIEQPALTAEKFIPNHLGSSGSRLYRTGDLVRYLDDGNIQYLGRIDKQVKVRGFRIELGEIEECLCQHDRVKTVAIVLHKESGDNPYLIAYVVPDPAGKEISDEGQIVTSLDAQLVDELNELVNSSLPEYMVPSAYIGVTQLPVTNNGKLDKARLPGYTPKTYGQKFVPLETECERMLANIWSKLLKKDSIGREDDFFSLGGHSLLITQLASRVRKEFNVEVSISDLFDTKILREQSILIESLSRASNTNCRDEQLLEPASSSEPKLLSFSQERLLFLSEYMGVKNAYNISVSHILQGDVCESSVISSLNKLMSRHDILHSSYQKQGDRIIHRIHELSNVSLELINSEEELTNIYHHEREYEFDLFKEPLCRIRLLKNAGMASSPLQQGMLLIITMHHSICDGWSIGVMISEFLKLYRSFKESGIANLTDNNIQYFDYAIWQRKRLQGEYLKEKLIYWSEKLFAIPPLLSLPLDSSRSDVQTYDGNSVDVIIEPAMVKKLRQFSKDNNVTDFMLLISAYFVTLSKFSRANDFAIGTPVAGRTQSELESLIGFFVNSLPIRGQLHPSISFKEFLHQIRRTVLECFNYQEVPLEKIVDVVVDERSLQYSPIFQVMFAMQNIPVEKDINTDINMLSYPEGVSSDAVGSLVSSVSRHDLSLMLMAKNDSIIGKMEFNSALFEKTTVKGFVDNYLLMLSKLIDDPETKLIDIEDLNSPECQVPRLKSHALVESGRKAVEISDAKKGDFPVACKSSRAISGVKVACLRKRLVELNLIKTKHYLSESTKNNLDIDLVIEGQDSMSIEKNKALLNKIRSHKKLTPLPIRVIELDKFPYLSSGTLDTIALREQIAAKSRLPLKVVEAKTDLEKKLLEVWKNNLGNENIGVECNYFSLGGDSIRAISLISDSEKTGIIFSAKHLFKHPSVRELASEIEQGRLEELMPIQSVEKYGLLTESERGFVESKYGSELISDAYPLSMMQEGMVLHSLKSSELNLYENLQLYQFKESWDASRFGRAMKILANKHQNMKSIYELSLDRPIQVILKEKDPIVTVVDLRYLEESQLSPEISLWMEKEKEKSIDVRKELWRVTAILLPGGDFLFCLFVHHALWDGWSLESFTSEVLATYQKLLKHAEVPSYKELPPYSLFIAQEQAAISSQSNRDYWYDNLVGAETLWWTGTERSDNGRVSCPISDATSQRICSLAKSLGVQEKSIWCTVYLTFLGLLNGGDEVTAPIISQGRPEVKGGDKMIGVFLNALPLRLKYEGKAWSCLIREVDAMLREQHAFRLFPIAEIQSITGLDFSAALFTYTNWHVYYEGKSNVKSNENQANFQVPEKVSAFQTTNYLMDVYVNKNERTQAFSLSIHADEGVFNSQAQQRFKVYIGNIIEQIVSKNESSFDKEKLIGEKELNQLKSVGELGVSRREHTLSFHELFEQNVNLTPDSIALTSGNQFVSYRELNTRANKVARFLNANGVGLEDKVGICTERTAEMVVALLAILKAGACYVALDPEYPEERLQFMVENSCCKMILCERHLFEELSVLSMVRSVPIDLASYAYIFDGFSSDNILSVGSVTNSELLAYELYTSGTSGRPKAVQITQRGLSNYLEHAQKQYYSDCLGGVVSTSFNFDATVTTLLTPLTCGKSVHLISNGDDVFAELQKLIFHCSKALVFKLTPAHLEALKHYAEEHSRSMQKHNVVVGGEALATELVSYWRECLLPNASFFNEYGPTETVVGSSIFRVDSTTMLPDSINTISIGSPIQNTEYYIVDEKIDLQPKGTPGELLIGGDGVTRGYLNQAANTASHYVPNKFNYSNGQRLYRTGDLVRLLETNQFEFLGRLDNQIKIRGYRIELSEIEAVIRSHELVRDVVVVAQEHRTGDHVLVAYIVGAKSNQHDITQDSDVEDLWLQVSNQVRKLAQCELPVYMVPSAFVAIDSIPLNVNGKINHEVLPKADFSKGQNSYVAPENKIERFLCDLWQNLLTLEEVGVFDNFWDIGGHSLKALRMSNMIRQEFKIEVPLRVFFEFQTVREISDYLQIELDSYNLHQSKRTLEHDDDEIDEGTF